MGFKIVVIIFLLVILYCLASGVYFLVKRSDEPQKLAKALTWRIGLSFCLFALLFVAYFLGWIKPHLISVMPPNIQ
jgi:cytochrome bd-type quinol oxidase subunit 1